MSHRIISARHHRTILSVDSSCLSKTNFDMTRAHDDEPSPFGFRDVTLSELNQNEIDAALEFLKSVVAKRRWDRLREQRAYAANCSADDCYTLNITSGEGGR